MEFKTVGLLGGGSGRGELGRGGERLGQGGEAAVFFAGFFDHAAGDEVLKFLVGAEAEHFFSTAGGVAGPEALVDDVEELLEFEGSAFFGKGGDELFSHQIRETTRERTFSLHKHEQSV